MSNKIFITGLPRSRTAWFAEYFDLLHEGLMHCRSLEDYYEKVDESKGDSDTALFFKWFEIAEHYNNPPLLIVMRNSKDVENSLAKFGMEFNSDYAISCLSNIIRNYDNTMLVPFDEINDRLPEICLFFGVPYDKSKDQLKDKRVVCDIQKFKERSVLSDLSALLGD